MSNFSIIKVRLSVWRDAGLQFIFQIDKRCWHSTPVPLWLQTYQQNQAACWEKFAQCDATFRIRTLPGSDIFFHTMAGRTLLCHTDTDIKLRDAATFQHFKTWVKRTGRGARWWHPWSKCLFLKWNVLTFQRIYIDRQMIKGTVCIELFAYQI